MSINISVLTGRLTADPELKTTQGGKSVCSFTIAVDSGYGDNKITSFIPVVAWNQRAEFVSKHFNKGSQIGIEGAIQMRKYTDKDGNNRTVFEIIANNIHFVGSKSVDISKDDTSVPTKDPMEQFKTQLDDFQDIASMDTPF